jgi:hypothetical protein
VTKLQLFESTLKRPWKTAGKDTQYKITDTDTHRLLSFQGSVSAQDWRDNFTFPVKPYRFQVFPWLAHGGFVRAWKAAQDQIMTEIHKDLNDRFLLIAGYSHGGAIAVLAHEDCFYNGLDPRTDTFGSPGVLWLPGQRIKSRFENLTIHLTRGDIVGHLPPFLLGYTHVGKVNRIGPSRLISHKPHYADCYKSALKET